MVKLILFFVNFLANKNRAEKELQALINTLNHLKNRNSTYRDSFLNRGSTSNDLEQLEALEEQCRAASENLFSKKKELYKI